MQEFFKLLFTANISNGEVVQKKWVEGTAGKIGYDDFVVSFLTMLMPRYPLMGFPTGLLLECA